MKSSNIIVALMILVLSVFTVLYFTHPRIITQDIIVGKIIRQIPDTVKVFLGPAPPDTIYIVTPKAEELGLPQDTFLPDSMLLSQKTFRESLEAVDIISKIYAYAPCRVVSFKNDITVIPNKKMLAETIRKGLPKGRRSFGQGIMLGASGVVIVSGIAYLILK